ncbi:hypothetical protein [Clostridium estertheticum]|uniref:hypothetical protein n=1 Tax=Clostridium estertheticum TaxID=238834 RepID=UPI001C7CA14F|nr:hypothetical protein [Clostridium estertheticum]MBX4264478.1 hypothetical protein [Clostridium estertheticum]WLC89316.1 hypothetical protein KTC95_03575 [Clostridium estertheticum]
MIRYQFYPSKELQEKISKEANEKGISISSVITEKLEIAYVIINDETQENVVFSDVLSTIQKEVGEYVNTWLKDRDSCAREFTLYKASETFKSISMADTNKRLVSMRPRLGKAFRSLVDNNMVCGKYVTPSLTDKGTQKREHNAAVYIINPE